MTHAGDKWECKDETCLSPDCPEDHFFFSEVEIDDGGFNSRTCTDCKE